MGIQHPALITGVKSCAEYLCFLGVRVNQEKLRVVIERHPDCVTTRDTPGGGKRYEWNPVNVSDTVHAITGFDLDLFLEQKKRDEKRQRSGGPKTPKRSPGRPRIHPLPETFVTWAAVVDGREVACRSTDDGAYPITWANRESYPVESPPIGGSSCLVAYVMRGKLESLKYRVTRLDLVGDGAWSLINVSDWDGAVEQVKRDWPDAIFFVLSSRSPTALEALERSAG